MKEDKVHVERQWWKISFPTTLAPTLHANQTTINNVRYTSRKMKNLAIQKNQFKGTLKHDKDIL